LLRFVSSPLFVSLNAQDACESIGVLPTIKVYIEELNRNEFNTIRGISVTTKDAELFESRAGRPSLGGGRAKKAKAPPGSTGKARKKVSQEGYFRLKVRDNGCGMNHDKIPDLLGRVLSGSKYGVRQTRGKFGLGECTSRSAVDRTFGDQARFIACTSFHC
jgi:hypothetical protein